MCLFVMAKHQVTIVVTKMHPITLAEFPHITICTWSGMHPFAIPVGLELVLPHIGESVFVDVALIILAADAQAT